MQCLTSPLLVLKLPINFFRFTDPLPASPNTILSVMDSLRGSEYSQPFQGLSKQLRSMSDLASALSLNGSFEVYTASKVPGLDRTSLLACGLCLGKHVCCRVVLARDASGGTVSAYANSLRVRQAAVQVVLSLISLVPT